MMRIMLKSKIHRATVTQANLKYMGSITIDKTLLKIADILAGERVQVVNLNNGMRVETYVVEGRANSGIICMNGAAARWAEVGDQIIIISYAICDNSCVKQLKPRIVIVDGKNKPLKK